MHALIALQRADGSWPLSAAFAALIGIPLDALESALGPAGGDERERTAWATALAVAWLERHAAGAEGEWYLLAAKARRWLGSAAEQEAWLARAAAVV